MRLGFTLNIFHETRFISCKRGAEGAVRIFGWIAPCNKSEILWREGQFELFSTAFYFIHHQLWMRSEAMKQSNVFVL